MLWKLDGLSEYDVRRPLTATGTNLLGLVKHLSMGESKYLGEVFGRPFPEHLPWWDEDADDNADKWVTAGESRSEIIERYQRVCEHSDASINLLELDSLGHVPWWPRPNVMLVNVIAHILAETNRHAGHADILREQLDGSTGDADASPPQHDSAWWRGYVATIEAAAQRASSSPTHAD
ncbi:MAG: DinB family protein [Actinomycetota bacterium]|nr:DinB family protein [Actinomycetota bacterium]